MRLHQVSVQPHLKLKQSTLCNLSDIALATSLLATKMSPKTTTTKWQRQNDNKNYNHHRSTGGLWSDYNAVVEDVANTGFDKVASVYEGNLGGNDLLFSHNPDWMVATSLIEIDSAVEDATPFFLYYVGDVSLFDFAYALKFLKTA
jgi:hypothetical protein